ncbi:MAG TPA: ABC transporter substrate-binding protein [Candidatus Limnocylindrales bacterium]|nr:ABC transporter substrate-binding protein [Candidatus Limnocylindrales bacterium]
MAAPLRSRAPRARREPRLAPILAALLVPLLLVLAACGPSSVVPTPPPDATSSTGPATTATPAAATSTPAPTFPLTLTDDEGTAVAVPSKPQRIVSLTPAATETLFAIGAGDRVVAKVEDIAAYPPEAGDLPVVATFEGVDVEQIVALEADLVVAGGLFFTPPDAITQLRGLGIPVIVLYAESVEQALAGIQAIGDAAGASEAAATLVASMRADFDAIAAATAGLDRPVTFYELDATSKIYTVPAGSLYAEMLELAGADPVTTDDSYEISLEELLAADPEVILLGDDADYTTAADVAARPGWGDITAVREGNVIPVEDYVLVTRPGPRLADGLRALVEALHPEALD